MTRRNNNLVVIKEHKMPSLVQRARFIDGVMKGCSPSFSAAGAGATLAAFQDLYAADPEFAQEWENAAAQAAMGLEELARHLAVSGNTDMLKFLLASILPERYDARVRALRWQREDDDARKAGEGKVSDETLDAVFAQLDALEAAKVAGALGVTDPLLA